MKEITIPINSLFEFFESKGYDFPLNKIVNIKESILLPDQNNKWQKCSGLIKKRDTTINVELDGDWDGVINKRVASNHIFIGPKLKNVFANKLKEGDKLFGGLTVTNLENRSEVEDVFGVQIESKDHIYRDADGVMHHNTYNCRQVMNETPSKLEKVYYKGNIGKSLTACAAFFYKYSNGYFIMLDDNDAMLMKNGTTQQIKLFFKAVLDPDAITQPIAVPTTVLKSASAAIEELSNSGTAKRRKRVGESIKLTIDKESLKEGIFKLYKNDKLVGEELVSLQEAMDLYYRLKDTDKPVLRERKFLGDECLHALREARNPDDFDVDDDEDNVFDPDTVNTSLEDEDDESEMPSSFIFDSSVCFISNLVREEIDPAIWDRFVTVRIELSPIEFMNKLEDVLPNLGRLDSSISSVPQDQVEWAKKVVFIILKGLTEAWAIGEKLMGVDINIKKRSMTFRMVMELVDLLLRNVRGELRKIGYAGQASNERIRAKVVGICEKRVIEQAIRKLVFGE